MRRLSVCSVMAAAVTCLVVGVQARQDQAVVVTRSGPPAASILGNVVGGGTGLILGQVVDADTGRPVAGATVSLGGAALPGQGPALPGQPSATQVTSNGQGHFLFRDLARSSYTVSAQANGYLTSAYGQRRPDGGPARTIDLADGQRVIDVVVRMWRVGVITGRVVDEAAEPVVGVVVRSARREATGRLVMTGLSTTDDRGIYRVAGLMPGNYVVFVATTFSAIPRAVTESFSSPTGLLQSPMARDVPSLALGGGAGTPVGDMLVMGGSQASIPVTLPANSADAIRAYPTTFHPASTSPADAALVSVASGVERAGVDINVSLTRMFSVSGVLEGPEGPIGQFGISLTPQYGSAFSNDANLDTAVTVTNADGRFTFLGVPTGAYEVRALRIPRPVQQTTQVSITFAGGGGMVSMGQAGASPPPAPDAPTLAGLTPVSVASADVTGVRVTVQSGTRLRGRVVFADGVAPPAADRQRFSLGLQAGNDRQISLPQPVPVDADLRFVTAEYPAGRYFINLIGAPSGWVPIEARVRGVNALVEPIALDVASREDDIVVTMSNRPPKIAGTVRASSGGDPNAVVVLFPADHRAWIDAGMPSRLVRTIDVRPNGTYEIASLIPGAYALVAVPADAPLDTRDADTLDRLAQRATRVTVEAGDQKTQSLSVSFLR